jgi:hypothetical protein
VRMRGIYKDAPKIKAYKIGDVKMVNTRRRTTAAPVVEEDVRVRVLNSFMTCPHRDTDQLKKIHENIREQDPLFYAHLACWYLKKGEIRDHNEVFASMLITDPFTDNREVGLALFRKHAPFMKSRILGFIKGKKVKLREKTGKKIKRGKKVIDEVKITEKQVGLKTNIPTSFKNDVFKYLKWLEADPQRFDAIALKNREDLKSLYFVSGKKALPRNDRAQAILFERKIPEDSSLNVLKTISEAKPDEAAKLIVKNKIPYTVAVGLVSQVTPSILIALINSMSPMEVINNMASLEEKGALENKDTKALIREKLKKAEKTKNVATLKSKTAAKTGRIKDEETLEQLDKVADAQVKKSGQITVPTAIFVDRSGSMNEAIKVGKNVAALISGATVADLNVIAFDNSPMEIVSNEKTLTGWEKAFKAVRPGGSTSIGCALDFLMKKNKLVETIVVITDEGENAHPMFTTVYEAYARKFNVRPTVVVIHVGPPDNTFSTNLKRANIEFDMYTPAGNDYYALPGLIPLLAKKSKLDLVYEIMDTPLLVRREFS